MLLANNMQRHQLKHGWWGDADADLHQLIILALMHVALGAIQSAFVHFHSCHETFNYAAEKH